MKRNLFSLTNLSIRRKEDFDLVYRKGKKFSFSLYSVLFFENESTKFALSIPKRFGKAVYRNKRKRILREFFRQYLFELPVGYYIFHLVRLPSDKINERKELEVMFSYLKNIKKGS